MLANKLREKDDDEDDDERTNERREKSGKVFQHIRLTKDSYVVYMLLLSCWIRGRESSTIVYVAHCGLIGRIDFSMSI